jgi:hypothetical protein
MNQARSEVLPATDADINHQPPTNMGGVKPGRMGFRTQSELSLELAGAFSVAYRHSWDLPELTQYLAQSLHGFQLFLHEKSLV